MSNHVHWQMFLKVSSKEKAERLLKQVARVMERELGQVACERYWKDEALFRATFHVPLRSVEYASAVLETLETCGRLAPRWNIGAPHCYEGGLWDFTGCTTAPGICVSGVTFIDFQAGNVEPVDPRLVLEQQAADSPTPALSPDAGQ